MSEPKKVAAIITVYFPRSHADVIVGKILEGFNYDGGAGPNLKLVSMYVDQFPETDMSRGLARKHGFKIYPTIERAVTCEEKRIPVDGVLCIGEHGVYPTNERGQVLYPRLRFFESTIAAFIKYNRAVPIFNDKHLSVSWKDAKWMYEKSRELFMPFLAGSSVPVAWRRPPLQLPKGCELTGAVQIGYSGLESYGFHALECLQCMVERRKGGETGVKSVQCVQGEAMWQALDQRRWSKQLLEAALARVPHKEPGDYRALTSKHKDAAVYLIEYRDGLKAAVAMLNGYVHGTNGSAFAFAGQIKGQPQPVSTHFFLQEPDPYAHFAELLKAIDATIQTNHAVYPIERTLLTTGILEAVMISLNEKNRKVETPWLEVRYTPTDWPFAAEPPPPSIKRP